MRERERARIQKRIDPYVDALVDLGLRWNEAEALMLVYDFGEVGSDEIRDAGGLRRSEISTILSDLIKRGWVDWRHESEGRKGRPRKIFIGHLHRDGLVEKVEEFIDSKKAELDEALERFSQWEPEAQ